MAEEDPKCTHCFQPITGDILKYACFLVTNRLWFAYVTYHTYSYGGKPYHVNHLLCTKCNTSLGAGVAIKNLGGKPHCAACWTAVMYGSASPGGTLLDLARLLT